MINSATQPTAPRTRRGRPRRTDPVGPGLPEIIEAVVALADNEDCTEIAMRDVAAALQVSPKLLYRHVSGKSEMLDLAASAIVEKWEFPASDMPWCDRLAAFIHETQHLLRRYPALAEAALLRTLKSDGEQQPGRVVAAVTE